ncbi:MAG: antirestriction protein [Bradyrhizobium sp.]|nr:antirestriction protein [Bradyrhizobium sp.]
MGVQFAITQTDRPRIYVACLAAYNNGFLHGAWIDAARDVWEIWQDIRDMLAASPIEGAEEHAIHDYEGFGDVRISEYADIDRVAEIAAFVVEHGALGTALLSYFSDDLDEARAAIDDCYLGQHASLSDYLQEVTEESIEIPESLRPYIDWASMAHDAELGGELFVIELGYDQAHVFAAR